MDKWIKFETEMVKLTKMSSMLPTSHCVRASWIVAIKEAADPEGHQFYIIKMKDGDTHNVSKEAHNRIKVELGIR